MWIALSWGSRADMQSQSATCRDCESGTLVAAKIPKSESQGSLWLAGYYFFAKLTVLYSSTRVSFPSLTSNARGWLRAREAPVVYLFDEMAQASWDQIFS